MSKDKHMISGNILKALLVFAGPVLLSNIFQQLYNTVDTVIVGNHLGELPLAALGASLAVYQLLLGLAIGFSGGFGIVAARYYGSGDEEGLKKCVAASIVLGIAMTLMIMLIGALLLKPLLLVLQTPAEIMDMTYNYIFIITLFIGVMFAYNFAGSLLRSIGNSVMPLVFLIISSVLNIGLDVLFVMVLEWGIEGAAIATVLAQGISVLMVIAYIIKKTPLLVPKARHFHLDSALVRDIFGQGMSMAMMLSIVFLGTLILQYAINGMGYQIIAGHTVARRIQSLAWMPVIALYVALSTFVSQNMGAGKRDRIRRGVHYSWALVIGWGLFASVIIWLFSEDFAVAMSGSADEKLIQTAVSYLRFNALFYGVVGMLLVTRNALQGLGEKVKPLVSSVIEMVLKVVFVIGVIPHMGYWGVIICEPVIWIFMLAHLLYVYFQHPYLKPVTE